MHTASLMNMAGPGPRRRVAGLGLVLVLHAALAWVLLAGSGPALRAVEPVREAVQVLLMEPPRTLHVLAAAPTAANQGNPARVSPRPQVANPAPPAVTEMAPPATPPAQPQALPVSPAPAAPVLPAQVAAPRADAGKDSSAEPAVGPAPSAATARAGVPQPAAAASPATQAAAPSQTPRSVGELCPGLVKAVPPARAVRAGLGGTVLARATVLGGRVVRVDILRSEPFGLFDAAVRQAMMQYRCRDQGEAELVAEQLFEFKLAD